MNLGIMDMVLYGVALLVTTGFLVALAVTGSLRERKLADGPTRDHGWTFADSLIGTALVLAYTGLILIERESTALALTFFTGIFPFFITCLCIARLANFSDEVSNGLQRFGLTNPSIKRDAAWALVALAFALTGVSSIGLGTQLLSQWLELPVKAIGHDSLENLSKQFSLETLLALIVSAAVIAPVLEEIVFRGVLQTSLLKVFGGSRWSALVYSAALFAIIHAWVVPWQSLFALFFLGLVFGYIYERTGSLYSAILCHALFNASNIGILLIGIFAGDSGPIE